MDNLSASMFIDPSTSIRISDDKEALYLGRLTLYFIDSPEETIERLRAAVEELGSRRGEIAQAK